MRTLCRRTRSFPPGAQLLMANQFAINLAFYMLMPFLAAHLAGDIELAAWAVGLVLGVRNLTQQGLFLVGGTLADRYGYKAPIMAGCLLRTVGFALLGWGDTLPALIAASAATGFAGALFNPASAPTSPPKRANAASRRSRCSTSTTRPGCCWARSSDWRCWPPTSGGSAARPRQSSPPSRHFNGVRCPTGTPGPPAPPPRPPPLTECSRNGARSWRTGRSCCSPPR